MKRRNTAVASLLSDLRAELLSSPAGERPTAERAAEHVALMHLEAQVLAAPRSTKRSAPRRASVPSTLVRHTRAGVRHATATRPRRFTAVFAVVCMLTGNVGLNAAGAVPAAVRKITDQITDSIVDTFGVPQASDPRSEGPRARAGTTIAPDSVSSPTGSTGARGSRGSGPSAGAPTGSAPSDPGRVPTSPSATDQEDPTSPPPRSESPTDPPLPPKNNMQKDPRTPPGLPSDWSERAVAAARDQLEACARLTDLAPAGCPQVAIIDGATSVQWKHVNQPLAGATAVAHAIGTPGQAFITVYGQFQMRATYTVANETQPRFAYSGGIAQATMTWDGSALRYVSFTSGSVADRLRDGVRVPSFDRPASDAAVIAAVQSGIAAWIPAAQGTLASDPTSGATVSFDAGRGDFTVTGAYATTTSAGSSGAVHRYTASLLVDGGVVQLLFVTST